MQNSNLNIARNVAKRLLEAEDAIDKAFACTAELAAFMPLARQDAKVSAECGQAAFEQITATMSMLSDARRRMIETHQALAETQQQAGLRERNFGGFVDKPPLISPSFAIVKSGIAA